VDKGGAWPSWLLDPMSSTHNEFRLAACPLSGVPGRVRAPCQLILSRVGKCAGVFGRIGRFWFCRSQFSLVLFHSWQERAMSDTTAGVFAAKEYRA
jgi:hypothetical protein